MRKYRGKRIDGKGWVKGFHTQIDGVDFIFTPYRLSASCSCCDGCECIRDSIACSPIHPVISESVGQSTGRRDRKRTDEFPEGQVIWERDIVRHNNNVRPPGVFQVYWNSPKMGFSLDDGAAGTMWLRDWCPDYCEVIGNTTDNPELLENKQ